MLMSLKKDEFYSYLLDLNPSIIKVFGLFLTLFFALPIVGQQLEVQTYLDDKVHETSGLIYLEGRLITHNDSGGEAKLYELDIETGDVVREVVLENAVNKDWEDICYDDNYIYIGDFGNNSNTRTDLKIYRISREDYFDSDIVTADIISFNYNDQTDFTYVEFEAEYDSEALISLGDSLYIFTKNWLNKISYVYPLPKTPGNYELIKIDSVDAGGVITGADICSVTGEIVLIGHIFSPFIVSISDYVGNDFTQGNVQIKHLQIPTGNSFQTEGIAIINPNLYYISAEENDFGPAVLYKLVFNTTSIEKTEVQEDIIAIYPNPASAYFTISTTQEVSVQMFNSIGQNVNTSTSKQINISQLAEGLYTVRIYNHDNQILSIQKLIVTR